MKKNTKQRLFEVMSRLDKTFKPLNENFEEFIPHGSYTVSNAGGYEIMISPDGDAAKVRDAFGSDNPQTSDWLEIEYIPDEETGELEPIIDPNGYNIPLNQVMRMDENVYKDDSPTNKAFRNFAKASDPEGHKRRWEKERPGEQEPEPEKPQARNQFKNDLNERKPIGINPKYTHFALLKDSKKFVNGWDFKGVDPEDLKQDKMHYFFQDIIDMDIDPKNVLIGTVKKFQKEGLDPFDSNNWYKFNADGWQEKDDLKENQVKYRAEVTGKGENVWSGNAMEYDTEEEAKQWLDNLSQRWFGYDMGRVVPTTTPKGQPVDLENDVIYQNFRR